MCVNTVGFFTYCPNPPFRSDPSVLPQVGAPVPISLAVNCFQLQPSFFGKENKSVKVTNHHGGAHNGSTGGELALPDGNDLNDQHRLAVD